MSNPFKALHDSHPRIWCIATFLPMVFITVLLAPIGVLYNIVIEIPRVMRNLWSDIVGVFRDSIGWCGIFGQAWKVWMEGWKGAKE